MNVRALIELLEAEDPELPVVVPWSIPRTARECVEVKELDMGVTDRDDFIPKTDERYLGGHVRVVALAPAWRGPDDPKKPEEAADDAKK